MEQHHDSPAVAGAASDFPLNLPEFTPVPVRGRVDGWTPERQRLYVASLACWASARRAAADVGLSEQSACRLRRRPDAASFARACEAAYRIGKIRRRAAAADPAAFFGPGGFDLRISMNLPPASARRPEGDG